MELRLSPKAAAHVGEASLDETAAVAVEALGHRLRDCRVRSGGHGVAAPVFFVPLAFLTAEVGGQVVLSEVVQAAADLCVQQAGTEGPIVGRVDTHRRGVGGRAPQHVHHVGWLVSIPLLALVEGRILTPGVAVHHAV